MKFTPQNVPKSRAELDDFVRKYGLRPVEKINYREHEIFTAETDLENDQPLDFPWGYYQTIWFVARQDNPEKMNIGRWADFDAMHDADQNWTPEAKRQARLQTVIKDARHFIDLTLDETDG